MLSAFLTNRACECGRTLWAFMGEPENGYALLITWCGACDTQSRATVTTGASTNDEPDDSGASAQKE